MYKRLALLLTLPLYLCALPPDFLPALQRALNATAEWKLEKTLAPSTLTFNASGTVACRQNQGIIWRTEQPYAHLIRLDDEGIRLANTTNLTALQTAPYHTPPYYQRIRRATQKLYLGDAQTLTNLFTHEVLTSSSNWCVRLTPRDRALSRVIQSTTLSGDTTLKRAIIDYTQGGRAVLDFSENSQRQNELWGHD